MPTTHDWWRVAADVEAGLTAACAGFTAVYFLNTYHRAAGPGRRTAALALALAAAGAATQAIVLRAWPAVASLTAITVLPACLGQALIALLVLRQIRRL